MSEFSRISIDAPAHSTETVLAALGNLSVPGMVVHTELVVEESEENEAWDKLLPIQRRYNPNKVAMDRYPLSSELVAVVPQQRLREGDKDDGFTPGVKTRATNALIRKADSLLRTGISEESKGSLLDYVVAYKEAPFRPVIFTGLLADKVQELIDNPELLRDVDELGARGIAYLQTFLSDVLLSDND